MSDGGSGDTSSRHHGTRERDLARIGSFSDAVLAIAITLLTLNIDVPDLRARDPAGLPEALYRLWPDLLAYALSFAVIGRFWIVHHRTFGVLEAVDGTVMALNLVFLGLCALVPFNSELLARYGSQPAATMSYGSVMALASFTSWGIISYAKRHGLVAASRLEESRYFGTRRAVILPAVFALTVPVALLSPAAAVAIWVLSFALHPARLGERKIAGRGEPSPQGQAGSSWDAAPRRAETRGERRESSP
jgi:uncharacterized membrane protein